MTGGSPTGSANSLVAIGQYLDVYVVPPIDSDNVILGESVTFSDTTAFVGLQREGKTSREELETAYEELQPTNEELETTNEELQSSNEELETTNEELETMNDELRVRSAELDEANTFLSGVLSSVPAGVIVLDTDVRVRGWNRISENLWGLRLDETLDESFFGLELGCRPDRCAIRPVNVSTVRWKNDSTLTPSIAAGSTSAAP